MRDHDGSRLHEEPDFPDIESNKLFQLSIGPFAARTLHVLRFRGRELLSRPYVWTVTFASSDLGLSEKQALGQTARLTLRPLSETPREVFGLVERICASGREKHGGRLFRVRIVPQLARLAQRRTSRVFEGKSVSQIIEEVLDGAGIPHRFELRTNYPQRAYCVQYDETDLGFVRRLCGEMGVWFRFDPPSQPDARGASEVVVFGDEGPAPEVEGGARFSLHPSHESALRGEETHVTSFEVRHAVSPCNAAVRGYDFRRPDTPLDARAEASAQVFGDPGALVYEHLDRDEDVKDAEHGLAETVLLQRTRGAHEAFGTSPCPRLAPGFRFVLEHAHGATEESTHVLTRVFHAGQCAQRAGEQSTYENRFACVPGNLPSRPRRPRRKARAVTETGTVIGPPGSEIHTDEHGRVRVRFHWQGGADGDETGACWARVVESWSGAAWGSQWIPRVGMEVLVTFLGGEASRPVVVGCLRNATHPAPFALPRDRATSGIRTQSTPGGDGYNELSFHDAKGAELVTIRAERDLAAVVRRDAVSYVGQNETVAVGKDRKSSVAGVDELDVGQRLAVTVAGTAIQEMSDQRIAHGTSGGAAMTLSGGNASLKTKGDIHLGAGGNITLDAAGNITIKAGGVVTIQAAGTLSIVGASITAEAGGAVVVSGSTVDLNP